MCLNLLTEVYLKLSSWQVYICDHLCTRMFHLQARIQLQKMETSIFRVEIFHSTCAHIAYDLGQLHSTLGHKEIMRRQYVSQSRR